MTIGAHAHVNACACTRIESERAQMSADMHTSGETDEDDRCECILAWMCVCGRRDGVGGARGRICVCVMEKCWIDMGAQWLLFEFHPSPHHCLHPQPPPNSPTGTNSASCHLRVLQARLKHSTPREENVSPGSGQFWQTEYILIHDKVC